MLARSERTSIEQNAGSGSRGFSRLALRSGRFRPAGSPTRVRKTGTFYTASQCATGGSASRPDA